MALSVEQKLAIESLIADNEEWSDEYGFGYIAVDDLKETFIPELLKIVGDSNVQPQ